MAGWVVPRHDRQKDSKYDRLKVFLYKIQRYRCIAFSCVYIRIDSLAPSNLKRATNNRCSSIAIVHVHSTANNNKRDYFSKRSRIWGISSEPLALILSSTSISIVDSWSQIEFYPIICWTVPVAAFCFAVNLTYSHSFFAVRFTGNYTILLESFHNYFGITAKSRNKR